MTEGPSLVSILRERSSEILAAWTGRFERSPLRFRRATKAAIHTAQVASLVDALTEAAHGHASALHPGSDATRELERSAAFMGARFASEGATGYDVAALLLELRDVLAGMVSTADAAVLTSLFEWLTLIALDGFATSGQQSLREQMADQLESGTPIVEILPKVPAILLVGAPTVPVLDSLLARAWMLAVSTTAPCLIIDCAGLSEGSEKSLAAAYGPFLGQASGSQLQVLLSSARRPVRAAFAAVAEAAGVSFQHFDHLDSAVAHALERAGHLLMRRG